MIIFVYLYALLYIVASSGVCDEKLLLMELKQDIEDNGILDCLRVVQQPHNYVEDWKEKNLRLGAQWDTDCSFEADYNWLNSLQDVVGISNLVDDTGDIVESDFDDQADMCEIIRAGLAAGKFSDITSEMTEIPLKILDYIDCPGDPLQTEVCAVTGGSLMQNDTWYILMDGLSINADQEPHFVKMQIDQNDGFEIPEVDAKILQDVENAVNNGEPTDDIAKKLNDNKDEVIAKLKTFTDDDKIEMVHFLSIKLPKFVNFAKTDEDWVVVAGLVMNEDTDEDMMGLAFYSIEGSFKGLEDANMATKVVLDGVEQLDTRCKVGNHLDYTVRGAFATKLDADFHQIQVEYSTNGVANTILPGDSLENNYDLKLIQFHPKHKMYKYVQAKPFTIYPSDKFEDTPARLTLEIKAEKQYILAFYQFNGQATDKIAMRLNDGEGEIPNTLCTSANQGYVNLFSWGVVELEEGDHDIWVSSISKQPINVNPVSAPWQTFAMTLLELPETTKHYVAKQEKDFKLEPGSWIKFGQLSLNLKLTVDKLCFFWYSFNGNTAVGKPVAFKLMVDELEIKTARSKTTNSDLISNAGSQGLKHLQAGEHVVEVFYRQMTQGPLEFASFDIYQQASLNVLVFDENPEELAKK